MASIHEALSQQFHAWEKRGRGWLVREHPVYPEPPFVPFNGYEAPTAVEDDGRRPTFLSDLVRGLSQSLATTKPPILESSPRLEPEPEMLERDSLVELQLSFPAKFKSNPRDFTSMLTQLAGTHEPVAFEIIGTHERVTFQFAAESDDARSLSRRFKAHFPEVILTETSDTLASQWNTNDEGEAFVVEFGLTREFVLPLVTDAPEMFVGLLAPLADLTPGELGVFQILFQPVEYPWAEHALRAVADPTGKPIFVNAPELSARVQEKVSSPLFAVVVRIAAQAKTFERSFIIVRDMATSLRALARMDGNELLPLGNDAYPFEAHVEDVLRRQTRRHGMLLNAHELTGFVHLPSAEARITRLMPELSKTKAAPKAATEAGGLLLGHNAHAGKSSEVRLSQDARTRHMHIIGASGSGKSTLLLQLLRQDLENGEGVAVLDPHGDLVDAVLGMIPEHRMDDVILLDPADETHAVGFNILSAHSELEKTLLASDLVSVFQRLSTSWGDQMNSVLQNAIMAFLESREGGTLMELRRFLIEPDFRKQFLKTVDDSEILYYWQKGFPQLTGNKSIGPIITRLDGFLGPKPIRHMVSQRENKLDFAHIMDTRKIFLAKLSQGQMGKENAFLLGSILVGKFQETAMSRQSQAASTRRPFTLLADEFQNFITPSMAEILTGTRKYGLGLILAHQELRQLEREREVASAVLGAHTRICFRLGDDDARKLADGFSSFDAHDLQNLNVGQAICRLERSDADFNLTVPAPAKADAEYAAALRQRVVTRSREKYSRLRSEVEAELRERLALKSEAEQPPATKTKPEAKQAEVPQPSASKKEPPPEEPPAVELPKSPLPPVPTAPVAEVLKPAPTAPKDLGRGGAQHKAIQQRLKDAAEQMGFRSTIEKAVLDGQGSVDLLLERDGAAIAVEITVSTTIDHEVGNVLKCLKAGFQKVAVVSTDEKRLREIESAVAGSLGPEVASRVQYFVPDSFLEHLRTLPVTPKQPVATQPAESTVRGYKVRRHTPKLTPDEQKQREGAAVKMLSDAMRQRGS